MRWVGRAPEHPTPDTKAPSYKLNIPAHAPHLSCTAALSNTEKIALPSLLESLNPSVGQRQEAMTKDLWREAHPTSLTRQAHPSSTEASSARDS